MGDSARGNEAKLVLYSRLPIRRFKEMHMTEFESRDQSKSFVPISILEETTDIAYFELKAAIAEQDKFTNVQDAKLVLKIFDHHFNPDHKDDFVPSKSADLTLRLTRLVSFPKSFIWDDRQLFAKQACVAGARLLVERNWYDPDRYFRAYLIDFMHLVLKSLTINDIEEP